MSDEDRDLAKEHATRASRQAKHAAANTVKAVEHEKDHIINLVEETADPISPYGLAAVLADLGAGIFASSVAVVSAVIATQKFRSAYVGRSRMVKK